MTIIRKSTSVRIFTIASTCMARQSLVISVTCQTRKLPHLSFITPVIYQSCHQVHQLLDKPISYPPPPPPPSLDTLVTHHTWHFSLTIHYPKCWRLSFSLVSLWITVQNNDCNLLWTCREWREEKEGIKEKGEVGRG